MHNSVYNICQFVNTCLYVLSVHMYTHALYYIGILGEFIVKERCDLMRSLLRIGGCRHVSYWVGTVLGDLCLLSFSVLVRSLLVVVRESLFYE